MNLKQHLLLCAPQLLLCAAGGLLLLSTAQAVDSAQASYRQEMAVCNRGASHQDTATCRTEAKNALAEARRGGLGTSQPATLEQYQRNALLRCNAHKSADHSNRSDCESRVRGEGSVSGSVGGGGILRETVTVIEPK